MKSLDKLYPCKYNLSTPYDYYNPYDEEDYTYGKVLQIKEDCEQIIAYLLDNKGTLAQAEKELCLSKSYIHKLIHSYIRKYYDEEYRQIIHILNFNKRYRFKQRKYWNSYDKPY